MLCGKIGLYYDTTGNNQHPFAQKYGNIIAFRNRKDLLSVIKRIIDKGYNPLDDIDPGMLRAYDHFRDNLGMERFIEGILKIR